MNALLKSIQHQFHHPRGLTGRIVGAVMAIENHERITWSIQKMNIQPDDAVLEIGFGPGLGIQQVLDLTTRGFVAGVDISNVMVKQATKRNIRAKNTGKMDLRQGSAEDIPFPDNAFSLVYAINSYHHWDDEKLAFQDIQRVLKPGGRLVIIEQPPVRVMEAGVIQARAQAIKTALDHADFEQTHIITEELSRGWTALVSATC